MRPHFVWKNMLIGGLLLAMFFVPYAYAQDVNPGHRVYTMTSDQNETGGNMLRMKMLQSAQPVTMQVKGARLCVTSKIVQMLPVYTEKGTFYGIFRLNKGTNWISGLAKGTYFINNTKIVIP